MSAQIGTDCLDERFDRAGRCDVDERGFRAGKRLADGGHIPFGPSDDAIGDDLTHIESTGPQDLGQILERAIGAPQQRDARRGQLTGEPLTARGARDERDRDVPRAQSRGGRLADRGHARMCERDPRDGVGSCPARDDEPVIGVEPSDLRREHAHALERLGPDAGQLDHARASGFQPRAERDVVLGLTREDRDGGLHLSTITMTPSASATERARASPSRPVARARRIAFPSASAASSTSSSPSQRA